MINTIYMPTSCLGVASKKKTFSCQHPTITNVNLWSLLNSTGIKICGKSPKLSTVEELFKWFFKFSYIEKNNVHSRKYINLLQNDGPQINITDSKFDIFIT